MYRQFPRSLFFKENARDSLCRAAILSSNLNCHPGSQQSRVCCEQRVAISTPLISPQSSSPAPSNKGGPHSPVAVGCWLPSQKAVSDGNLADGMFLLWPCKPLLLYSDVSILRRGCRAAVALPVASRVNAALCLTRVTLNAKNLLKIRIVLGWIDPDLRGQI